MLVRPRIGICHRHFAVAVAPVAFAPVAGVVADACVGNGSSKDVCHRLQILSHETSIAGTDTTNLSGIHPCVLLAERLGGTDDVLCHAFACSVYVAGREFLSESCSSTWIHNQHHIALSCVCMLRITTLEIATCR